MLQHAPHPSGRHQAVAGYAEQLVCYWRLPSSDSIAPMVASVTSVCRIRRDRRVRNIRNRTGKRFLLGENDPDKGQEKAENGFKVLHVV